MKSRIGRLVGRRGLLAVALGPGALVFALGGVGCADLLGLRQRDSQGLDLDPETQRFASPLCIAYCDVVMEACTGDDGVYTTRSTCLDTCGALPPGDENEPAGNTVACRKRRAADALAQDAPAEFCPAAGPTGSGSCGDDCEAWCGLLEAACPAEFTALSDCPTSCLQLSDAGTLNTSDYYTGDTLQCRLIHVSAAFGDPDTHCVHAQFAAPSVCIDGEGSEPTCDAYCRNAMAACTEDRAVYETKEQCLSTCGAFPVGALPDRDKLSVGCRQYHAMAALSDPASHCGHSGPGGDGSCAVEPASGNCEAYCLLLEAGCGAGFVDLGGDQTLCQAACQASFRSEGADAGSGYSVQQASEEDGLACRFLKLSQALDGDESACDHVRASDSCP